MAYYYDVYLNNQRNEEVLLEKMMNGNDLVHVYRLNQKSSLQYMLFSTSASVRIDPAYKSEFFNMLNWQKVITLQDERRYQDPEIKAARLCRLIKQDYDLE